ncbi:MAG TPA: YkvA family protein, partial [Neobacillus sp.]
IEQKQSDDIQSSIESIQNIIDSSHLYNKKFTIESVEQQLAEYEQFSLTEEGKETILKRFEEKLQKLGSIGPLISNLKDMFERFRLMKGSPHQLAIIGSALIYFILPVDVIPDYIFPIGYLDDAIAVQLVLNLLTMHE